MFQSLNPFLSNTKKALKKQNVTQTQKWFTPLVLLILS